MIGRSRAARVALAAVLACSASFAGAQAPRRDERQNLRSTAAERVCTYQERRLTSAGRRQYSLLVGRGEPCPARPPQPAMNRQVTPSLATLAGQSRRGANLICVYGLGGRLYEENAGSRLACPLTPYLF